MGAWSSRQSGCTDITGYSGMDTWSVFYIKQWVEHRNLRPDQIKLLEPPGSPVYLLYTEDASKKKNHED